MANDFAESNYIGEWADSLSAWWSGVNGMEHIAFKGSNQVFVYYPETYPGPPDMILQHTGRIETHADFDEAMRNGKKYSAEYTEVDDYVFEWK
jgi:hypothetical protein